MSKERAVKKLLGEIEENRDTIIELGRKLFATPETGFQEHKTAEILKEYFADFGMSVKTKVALTGLISEIDFARPGPSIAILADMDALPMPSHPDSDPQTGAVHACGHHAQMAAMMGAALAFSRLRENDIQGKIIFMAVPAEEYVQIERRLKLREVENIEFLSGKSEMIRQGYFEDVDAVLATHSSALQQGKIGVGGSLNGFLVKNYVFKGRPAHAGGAPHKGRNALDAASLALDGINAQRSTFQEDDYIRVHPIMPEGGDTVNIVPDKARVEAYVRAKSLTAIEDTEIKVDRAAAGGALAMGCDLEIQTTPGYLPAIPCEELNMVLEDVVKDLSDLSPVRKDHFTGSSDLGDLSQLLPAGLISMGGIAGSPHSQDFAVRDEYEAYIVPARVLSAAACQLLRRKKEKDRLFENFTPRRGRESYVKWVRSKFTESSFSSSDLDL